MCFNSTTHLLLDRYPGSVDPFAWILQNKFQTAFFDKIRKQKFNFPCITSQRTQEVLFHSIANKQLVALCDAFGDLQ